MGILEAGAKSKEIKYDVVSRCKNKRTSQSCTVAPTQCIQIENKNFSQCSHQNGEGM